MRSPYTQPSRISFLTDDVVDQTTTTTHKFSGTSDAPVDNTAHHADITQSQAAIHHRHTALSNAGNRCKDGQARRAEYCIVSIPHNTAIAGVWEVSRSQVQSPGAVYQTPCDQQLPLDVRSTSEGPTNCSAELHTSE